jgi:hypothetical protein
MKRLVFAVATIDLRQLGRVGPAVAAVAGRKTNESTIHCFTDSPIHASP